MENVPRFLQRRRIIDLLKRASTTAVREGNDTTGISECLSPELAIVLHGDAQFLSLALAHFVPLLRTAEIKDRQRIKTHVKL